MDAQSPALRHNTGLASLRHRAHKPQCSCFPVQMRSFGSGLRRSRRRRRRSSWRKPWQIVTWCGRGCWLQAPHFAMRGLQVARSAASDATRVTSCLGHLHQGPLLLNSCCRSLAAEQVAEEGQPRPRSWQQMRQPRRRRTHAQILADKGCLWLRHGWLWACGCRDTRRACLDTLACLPGRWTGQPCPLLHVAHPCCCRGVCRSAAAELP